MSELSGSTSRTEATETIVARIFIAGTAEAVWREITKTDEAQGCFFNAWLNAREVRPGEMMAMRDKSGRYTTVIGKILEVDPPRRFSHTMRFTRYDDPESTVTYEIEPTEGGVIFTLTVDGVPTGTRTAKDMAGGAKMIVGSLKRIVEKGDLAPMLKVGFTVMEWVAPLITPARCRTERWPLDRSK